MASTPHPSALTALASKIVGTPADEVGRNARTVGTAMLGSMIVGVIIAADWNPPFWAAVLMWAAASSAVGWFLGFIFGIPRVPRKVVMTGAASTGSTLAGGATGGASSTVSAGDTQQVDDRQGEDRPKSSDGVNTNLEEISDWLTKIIVGVSLVELRKVQAVLEGAAMLIARSIGGPSEISFAYALMLYFSISGFLGAYLLTRLYLQKAFSAASS